MDVAASLDHVCLDFGPRRVLDDVTLDVPTGTLTALVGPNGCGKSTIARMLAGFLHPTSGTVRLLGDPLGTVNVHALRERVKLVQPTQPHPPEWRMRVRDVILTGAFGTVDLHDAPTQAQRSRADELGERFGLTAVMGTPFETCSSGERMRAQLARSLVSRPELLILDEPTAGLDLPMRERFLATLDALCAAADAPAVLLVTHHLEELPRSARHAVVMGTGRVHASGMPDHVLTSAVMSAAFAFPIEVTRTADGRFAARAAVTAGIAPG